MTTAADWYRKGYDFQMKQANQKDAYEMYKKANEADPNYANAYFGMASC